MIVDCHAHIARAFTGFWQPLRYGKVQDRGQARQLLPPSFDPPTSPPEVLLGYMDDAGVDKAFLVQHHMYGDQNTAVLESVLRWPERFVGFAYLGGLDRPDAPDQLTRLINAGMTGLKVEVASTRRLNAAFQFDGENERRVWQRLDDLGRPIILDINAASPEDIVAIGWLMEQMPHVKVLICHVGGVPQEGWQPRALLARHPRAWIDLAGVPMAWGPEQEYPYLQSQEVVRWAVASFGADKVMWGTDYPPSLMHGTYRQLLDFVGRHCDFLNYTQKADILGDTAERFIQPITR